ncbi:MAG: DUF2442 domain-containing protein [Pontiellaceae bacterium]|jgi:hypothetical protein|nr:DUF2442 domain-containing protein [Pontiellaceae bacterium]
MIIKEVLPLDIGILRVVTEDGRSGTFDVRCYMNSSAFAALEEKDVFSKVRNGGYYIEWACGADLSADTLEAGMKWDKMLMVAEDPGEYKTGQ